MSKLNYRLLFSLKDESKLFAFDDEYLHKCNNNKMNYPWLFRQRLLKYIRKAPHIFVCCDQDICIFNDKEYIYFSGDYFSDGEWVWSADLIHYTKKHYFRWPQEFIELLQKRNFKRPKHSEIPMEGDLVEQPVFIKVLGINIIK